MHRLITVCFALALVVSACGDDDSATTTTTTAVPATTTTAVVATTTTPATTTTTTAVPATTTTAVLATTTTPAPPRYTIDELPGLVAVEGDPWAVPVANPTMLELALDDVWPADQFPQERATYRDAGFVGGYFSAFVEEDGLLLTAAHLFETAGGARAALELLEGSFTDTDLIARITNLQPGSLIALEPLPDPSLGDAAVGVMLFGPDAQVVGLIWITDNLLQFVRTGMALGDEERTEAAFFVAEAMAGRTG